MKAILTKYHGPTNFRGSRISAVDSDRNRVTISYDDALNSEDAHRKAAEALAAKMGWPGKLAGGGVRGGYAWVFIR